MNYQIPGLSPVFFIIIYFWSILWKGVALWRASAFKQKNWFIVLLVLNTIGILEVIYLFYFAKKKLTLKDIKETLKSLDFRKTQSR